MTENFYTSDVHAGHEKLALARGFATTEAHNAEIRRRWNAKVGKHDTVWVLGDVALGRRSETLRLFSTLHGVKHLVWGNHENCFPAHDRSWTYHPMYLRYFKSVQGSAQHRIAGHRVMLSHFPYTADRPGIPPRLMEHRLRDEGLFLLHGHLHSPERITSGREIHVGMDAWDLTPVPGNIIAEMIVKLKGESGAAQAEDKSVA